MMGRRAATIPVRRGAATAGREVRRWSRFAESWQRRAWNRRLARQPCARGMGSEHAVKSDEWMARWRDQRCEPGQELHGGHDAMGLTRADRIAHFVQDSGFLVDSLLGMCSTGDVVLFMSSGNLSNYISELKEKLKEKD